MQRIEDIAGHLLDVTGDAMSLGDESAFLAAFDVPHEIDTGLDSTVIRSYAELSALFGRLRSHWRSIRIDRMERRCLAALALDADTIVQVHQTRLLRDGRAVQPAFKSLTTLRRHDHGWRVANGSYALQDRPEHSRALIGPRAGAGAVRAVMRMI